MSRAHKPKIDIEAEKLKRELDECVKGADDLYHHVKNKATQTIDEAQVNFKEYRDDLTHFVREKPIMSVLIAGGIGFILSSLFKK